jgi:hypothetical protein
MSSLKVAAALVGAASLHASEGEWYVRSMFKIFIAA